MSSADNSPIDETEDKEDMKPVSKEHIDMEEDEDTSSTNETDPNENGNEEKGQSPTQPDDDVDAQFTEQASNPSADSSMVPSSESMDAPAPSSNVKQELATRLKKRIEGRDESDLPLAEEAMDPSPNANANASSTSPTTTSDPALLQTAAVVPTPTPPKRKRGRPPKKKVQPDAVMEVVEGFQIISTEAPPDVIDEDTKKKRGMDIMTPNTARRSGTPSKAAAGGFGPGVLKQALKAMGGRATGNALAEWVINNKPEYLNFFGDKKKLRYSIIGILSAKAYGGVFSKQVVTSNGIKRSEWFLSPDADTNDDKLMEESVNGLLSLSAAPLEQPVNVPANPEEVERHRLLVEALDKKVCSICTSGENDDQLLLCDACDNGYHLYCLQPPLTDVPVGTWFCDACSQYAKTEPQEQEYVPENGRDDIEPFGEPMNDDEFALNQRACEKHRRWKKRCPFDCPLRKNPLKFEKQWKSKRGRKPKKYHDELLFDGSKGDIREVYVPEDAKQLATSNEATEDFSRPLSANNPTYIDMIEEAITALGGAATTPDITNYMEEKHGELLQTKTKTWRNSVSGCLSTHFQRLVSKDQLGRIVWTLKPKDMRMSMLKQEKAQASNKIRVTSKSQATAIPVSAAAKKKDIPTAPFIPPRFKAPGRSTATLKRLFDPKHLEELRLRNKSSDMTNYSGIEFINKANPLEIIETKLEHPGAVYAMGWSADGTMLVTANTVGTIRIWDVTDWTLLQEVQDVHEQGIIEEFYDVEFTKHDTYAIAIGKTKNMNSFNEETGDYTVVSGSVKVFDIVSGCLAYAIEGHQQDVLGMKIVPFNGENYLLTCGQDGMIVKWHLSKDWTKKLGGVILSPAGSGIAVSLDIVPQTGNKFFAVSFNTGLKIYDFETEECVQTFPNLYTYLCDCVKFVDCSDLKPKKSREYYLLTRGVELLTEDNEIIKPNTCNLKKLSFPEQGIGKVMLEEVDGYEHPDYLANVWLMKIASNGRYVLAPTIDGRVFVWNIRSCEIVAILSDHLKSEVRSILFHPSRKLLLTAGDDTTVRIYHQGESEAVNAQPEDVNMVEAAVILQQSSPVDKTTDSSEDDRKKSESDDEDTDHGESSSKASSPPGNGLAATRNKRKIVKTEKAKEFEASLKKAKRHGEVSDGDEDYKSKRKSSKPKKSTSPGESKILAKKP